MKNKPPLVIAIDTLIAVFLEGSLFNEKYDYLYRADSYNISIKDGNVIITEKIK